MKHTTSISETQSSIKGGCITFSAPLVQNLLNGLEIAKAALLKIAAGNGDNVSVSDAQKALDELAKEVTT